ncbi:MAG: hypothetical protein R2734_15535 [Nocardioides sp.]
MTGDPPRATAHGDLMGSFVNQFPRSTASARLGRCSRAARSCSAREARIRIKGPGVMEGCQPANLPDETGKTLTEDGWLRTGDKGGAGPGRLPAHHRTDQGAVQDLGRQASLRRPSREVQGAVPVRQPVHGVRQRSGTSASR